MERVYLHGLAQVKKQGDTLYINSDGAGVVDEKTVIATGSDTPRTLADRFGDVINVRDFGAVGDGHINTVQTEVPKPVVVIVAGQSNAIGLSRETGNISVPGYFWNADMALWQNPVVDPVYPSTSGGFVPAMCEYVHSKTNRPIYIINVAVGATNCANSHINPAGSWGSAGNLRGRAESIIENALSAINMGYDMAGFIWLQGESDAVAIHNGLEQLSDYESCIEDTINWAVTTFNCKFIASLISYMDNDADSEVDSINDTLEKVINKNNNAVLSTDITKIFRELGYLVDEFHYTQQGYNLLGEKLGVSLSLYIENDVTITVTVQNSITGSDDTKAIQAALDACPEDGMVVFPKGIYVISYALFIKKSGIKLISLGAELSSSYNGSMILVSADRVVIDGFSFIGDVSLNRSIGVYFQKTQFSTVQNCYFYRLWRAVQMGNERAGELITLRCHVLNNYIAGCLGIGICISNSRYPKIAFNKIRDSGSEHVTLDNQTYYAEVHNNTMYGMCVGSGAIGMDGGSMAVITGNHIQINNPNKPAIAMNGHTDPTNYCVVSGNYFEGIAGSTVPAIWLKGGSPVLDETLDNDIYGSSYNIISDNIFRTFKNGIALRPYSGHNKIGKNQYVNITEDKIIDENGTNDIGYSNYSMPSSNKLTISYPDNHSTITAPANGWYAMVYQPENGGTAITGWLDMANLTTSVTSGVYINNSDVITGYRLFLPVKKGDVVRFDYPITPRSDSLLYFVKTDDVQ